MRFDEKARENLQAAERLLPDDEEGSFEQWPNASASRAYYAAYLALADAAQQAGISFTSDKGYYRHDGLPTDALEWGLLDADESDGLTMLHDSRIKADYWEDQIDLSEASQALEIASTLVNKLLSPTGTA